MTKQAIIRLLVALVATAIAGGAHGVHAQTQGCDGDCPLPMPQLGPASGEPAPGEHPGFANGPVYGIGASSVRSESWGSGTNLRWSVVAEIKRACRLRSAPQAVVVASVVAPPLGAVEVEVAALVVVVAAAKLPRRPRRRHCAPAAIRPLWARRGL